MPIDPQVLSLIDELEQLRETRTDHWQIPRAEGELLYHIALSSQARTILEVGTSYGFSGLFWCAALLQTGGRLHTIDADPRKYESARQTFARAGVADHVTSYLGDAAQILPSMPGPIDLAFLDADKDPLRHYFDLIWPTIAPGGSVITDNATTHREQLSGFVHYVRTRPDASSVEVAVGNGIEWTVKRMTR